MKIAKVEAFPLRLPRDWPASKGLAGSPNELVAGVGDYRWSKDYPALYSTQFETALIKVTLNNGLVGWGESQAPLAPEVASTIVERLLRPILEGQPFDGTRKAIEQWWHRMYSTMRVRGQTGGFMLDAIAGVDIALWDLAGKISHKPVSVLLKEDAPKRVRAYLSGVPDVAAARDLPFTEFKVYYESDWKAVVDTVQALPGKVAVDALWHLPVHEEQAYAWMLDEVGAWWLECPLLPEDPLAHAELQRAIKTPIAIGESYRTHWELTPYFQSGAMRIVQPDLGRCGITEALRIADMAEAFEMQVVPHVSIAFGPQLAAALHFAVAAGCRWCEYNPRVVETANRFLMDPVKLDGAEYLIPQGYGLGIEMRVEGLGAA
ncbi:MAG: mandelate racemase/muconate lactonizing enzyme family protein [Bryobacterales bacterium]|nr:mandelate racemase/muconate lactonizing enzyme family protein [Bryobacterales bacterium]